MAALGVGLVWAGYYLAIYGYCLVKGYDTPFGSLMHTTWPGVHVATQAPTGGHKLGTITGNASTTNPGQVLG
jgi:hypothetical protein